MVRRRDRTRRVQLKSDRAWHLQPFHTRLKLNRRSNSTFRVGSPRLHEGALPTRHSIGCIPMNNKMAKGAKAMSHKVWDVSQATRNALAHDATLRVLLLQLRA